MYLNVMCRCDFDAEQFAESSIPILVVGTKLDQVATASEESSQRSFSIAEECGADEVNLVITDSFSLCDILIGHTAGLADSSVCPFFHL